MHVDQTHKTHANLSDIITNGLKDAFPDVQVEAVGDPSIAILGDQDALASIFAELTRNAVLHGFPKSETSLLRIDIDWSVTTEGIEVQFRDNGQGIQEEHRPHVFEPFFTAHGMASSRGLGLYNVYNTVTNVFGGTIHCLANEDGAHFVVKFRQATGS